jgi:glycosyltransferase involved in cell wall biosynthesis
MHNPLISIITVVFNDAKSIEKTISSVINQTYNDIEYIIIDGGSNDSTVDIIKKYESKLTYWISEPDRGIYDAMNKGINRSHGKWVLFMNSGDIFYSNQVIKNIFSRNIPANKLVIYGNTVLDYGTFQRMKITSSLSNLWKGMVFTHQSSLMRTDIIKKYYFDTSYNIAADYNLLISLWNDFGDEVFYKIDVIVSCYRATDGISNIMRMQSIQERQKILKSKSIFSIKRKIYYLYLKFYVVLISKILLIFRLIHKIQCLNKL